MDTTYFSIDAKRILVHRAGQAQKAASGGTVSTCYMVVPRRKRPRPAQSGIILDFEACRRALLDSFAAMKTFNEYLNEALEGFAMPTR